MFIPSFGNGTSLVSADQVLEGGDIQPVIAVVVEANGARGADQISARLNTIWFKRLFQSPERRAEAPSRAVRALLPPEELRQCFTRMRLFSIEHQPGQ